MLSKANLWNSYVVLYTESEQTLQFRIGEMYVTMNLMLEAHKTCEFIQDIRIAYIHAQNMRI